MGLLTRTWFYFSLVACFYRSDTCTQIPMNYEFGKKLEVIPFMILKELGFQMCFKECEAYSKCVSINYHLQHFICKLNSVRKDVRDRPLVNDQDYAYHEIPYQVSAHAWKSLLYILYLILHPFWLNICTEQYSVENIYTFLKYIVYYIIIWKCNFNCVPTHFVWVWNGEWNRLP